MVAGTQSSSKGEVEATCSLSDRTTRAMQDEGMGNGARQKGLRAGPRLPMSFISAMSFPGGSNLSDSFVLPLPRYLNLTNSYVDF